MDLRTPTAPKANPTLFTHAASPCSGLFASAAAAYDWRRNAQPRVGRCGCGACDRRCLCRSPQLCQRPDRPTLRSGWVSGGRAVATRLEHLPTVAHIRPSPTLFRHLCRQHGLDDQPLHRQQKGPQRRRLFSERTDRPPSRPRHARILPAFARGLSWCACGGWRRRGQPPQDFPLRLLERHRPAVDPDGLQGRSGGFWNGRAYRAGCGPWTRCRKNSEGSSGSARHRVPIGGQRGITRRRRHSPCPSTNRSCATRLPFAR